MRKNDVVVIGGGPAGRVVVHTIHAAKKDLSVTLIKDEEINVNRCAVPYGVSSKKPIKKFKIPNELVTDFGAELVIDQVARIDIQNREVHTYKGDIFAYNDLVIATGSRPLVPPISGVESKNITAVRSLHDLERLRGFVEKGAQKAVVVGGGYIGIEIAVVLRELGLDVTVVEALPHILLNTTEPEFIGEMEKVLAVRGVALRTSSKVAEFMNGSGKGVGVRFADGDSVDADFVVLSVGVAPNMELAKKAGIQTSPFGIVTDENMRTSAQNVYAAGDCAEKRSFITGHPIRGEFGTNSVFMSKTVAQNILGENKAFPGVINANASTVFEWSIGSAGLTEKMAHDAGLDTITGFSEVLDRYPMMDGVSPIRTKMVFDRSNGKLVGGSVLRRGGGTAQNVDFISLAIQMGATLEDLLSYQYATHPELAAKPSDNTYVFAAKDAKSKW